MSADKTQNLDFLILGAGIFGLYAGYLLARRGFHVAVMECDGEAFSRASYINQARVHKGYHYPRSVSTAMISAKYFRRFCEDFKPAVNNSFKKIYAISNRNSYTTHRQFLRFCEFCRIPVMEVNPSIYFNPGVVEGAYETEEYAFDSDIIKEMLIDSLKNFKNLKVFFNKRLVNAQRQGNSYNLFFEDGYSINTKGVFNTTYGSVNQVLSLFGFELFDLKYEICELILCDVDEDLQKLGITVMDGSFFSIMPFGKRGVHSLTAVDSTPHKTCFDRLPAFDCQNGNTSCTQMKLQNCNVCASKPQRANIYTQQLAKKYLKPSFSINFRESLFCIKPILLKSELDDSRPTIVKKYSESPLFVSVLSGKINTIYELEDLIDAI